MKGLHLTLAFVFIIFSYENLISQHVENPSAILSKQPIPDKCGFDNIHQKKLQDSKTYRDATKKANKLTYNLMKLSEVNSPNNEKVLPILTIPVVVHVMHLGEAIGSGSNISDAQIQAGLDHLNDAFRNTDVYAGGPFFSNAGIASADVEIEFCLAVRDPAGNPTTGINRIQTTYSNLDADEACTPNSGADTQDNCMKALSFWDSNNYMNVWIVNEICTGTVANGNYSCGTAGYAYLAGAHGQLYDGVVIEAAWWGTSSDNSKVHIHEVGHYLNLYHTFRQGCTETNCLTEGDMICDTPPDASTTAVTCFTNATTNTCHNDAAITNSPFGVDVQDIYEDYMDYGYQQCQNTFTPNQVTRMRTALSTTRASLLTSLGCTPAAAPISDFTSSSTAGCEGETITYQDNSTNGTSSWSWTFPGGTPSSSSLQNPTITYNTSGVYDVTLIASNGVGVGSTMTKSNYVTIHSNASVASCAPSGATGGNGGIRFFSMAEINNTSNNTNNYTDFICDGLSTLQANTHYELSVTVGAYLGSGNPANTFEIVKFYIDYNNDGDFVDVNENVTNTNSYWAGGPLTTANDAGLQFTTLANPPVVGQVLRMRVIADSSPPNSCTSPSTGEVEDYRVFFPAPLPIELLYFSGKTKKEGIILDWRTVSEINNDFFTLEHSTDGIYFNKIAEVAGKGSTNIPNNYQYLHLNPINGANYYRLSQTNLDGTREIANVITVKFKTSETTITIAPNPVSRDILNLHYESPKTTEVEVEIVDITGQVLFRKNITVEKGKNRFNLPVHSIANGVYFLRIKQAQTYKSIRFIKTE